MSWIIFLQFIPYFWYAKKKKRRSFHFSFPLLEIATTIVAAVVLRLPFGTKDVSLVLVLVLVLVLILFLFLLLLLPSSCVREFRVYFFILVPFPVDFGLETIYAPQLRGLDGGWGMD